MILLFVVACVLTLAGARESDFRSTRSAEGVEWLNSTHRQIQETIPACNQLIEFLSVSQVSEVLGKIIENDPPNALLPLLKQFTPTSLMFDVQVFRICASCVDVSSESPAFEEFCGSDDYGYDERFSGLLMLPVTEDGTRPKGTMKGMLYMHGTSTAEVPSIQWKGDDTESAIRLSLGIASAGSAVIFPDYMGYVESASTTYKSYIIRKSYETSIVPLWLFTQDFLLQESDCQAALGHAAYILGYDEGGYASVAVADALSRLGVDVVAVFAGGAPFRTGTQTLFRMIEGVDSGTFPTTSRHLLALFGSSYSSFYPDVANFQQGQDVLAAETRDSLAQLIMNGSSKDTIQMSIPESDPLSIYNPDFLSFARNATAMQIDHPCSEEEAARFGVESLCAAFQENDLTTTLESATFPVTVCHSRKDELISFANVPNVTRNPFLSYLPAPGGHGQAGEFCLLTGTLLAFSGAFQTYIPPAAHSEDGCPSTTFGPSVAPSHVPSEKPTTAPSNSQSCAPRRSSCTSPFDCCSKRCVLNTCQSRIVIAKNSLSGRRGGAAGGPQGNANRLRRVLRGL